MSDLNTKDQYNQIIFNQNSPLTITSREIAELTGKRHDNVMRDIRRVVGNLEKHRQEQLASNNRCATDLVWCCETEYYLDGNGRKREYYRIDKYVSGCLLAGYNDVSRFIIVKRWDELEKAEANRSQNQFNGTDISAIEIALQQNRLLTVNLEQTLKLAKKQEETDRKVDDLKTRVEMMDGDTGYRTVIAHGRINGFYVPSNLAKTIGISASKLARKRGFTVGIVPDERWGTVNSYPIHILDEVFPLFFD
jgi:phage regulator Rha-like protein